MQGHNAEYLEQLYARYRQDPNAVDASWREFFQAMGDAAHDVTAEAAGPSWGRSDWPPVPHDDLTQRLDGQWARTRLRPQEKIQEKAAEKGVRSPRINQTRCARLDPRHYDHSGLPDSRPPRRRS